MALGIERPEQIDLETIAWEHGALVKHRPLDRCEAMIVGAQRRAIITVNSRAIPTRRRFSLAHEIGHWHHHRGQILFCGSADIGNPAHGPLAPESQADQFASDLLLPDFMFRPRAMKMKRIVLSAVREIAEEFNVSLTATLLKLVDFGPLPDCYRMPQQAASPLVSSRANVAGLVVPERRSGCREHCVRDAVRWCGGNLIRPQSRCGSVVPVSWRGAVRHSGAGLPAPKR